MTNEFRKDIINVFHRFENPNIIEFPQNIVLEPNYTIFNIKKDDVFIVNPCLCIWVDIGYQQLQPLTTTPRHLKFIKCDLNKPPLLDIKDIDQPYSHIFMVTDLSKNRNYMKEENLQAEIDYLTTLVEKFKNQFVGDLQ